MNIIKSQTNIDQCIFICRETHQIIITLHNNIITKYNGHSKIAIDLRKYIISIGVNHDNIFILEIDPIYEIIQGLTTCVHCEIYLAMHDHEFNYVTYINICNNDFTLFMKVYDNIIYISNDNWTVKYVMSIL
jgi:hypothetical protein